MSRMNEKKCYKIIIMQTRKKQKMPEVLLRFGYF